MQERVETLEAQLAEKEQLVAALTERLEQAAEQLDRLHRTGADRTLHAGIIGIPPQLIEQQQKLVDELQRAVQQWEDMQPGAFFGRLEAQLAQIREMVQGFEGGSADRGSDSSYSLPSYTSTSKSPSSSPQSILDFMKSSFNAPTQDAPAGDSAENGNTAPPVSAPYMAPQIDLPPLADAPEAVDLQQGTREELARACDERDQYIVYLLQRLRQIESFGHVPNSWADVENLPVEMRERLEALEKRLEETLRLAEVELSLQRAKLAREEVRVRMMDEQLQKELKRIRDSSGDDGKPEDQAGGGRWRRMLGRRENG